MSHFHTWLAGFRSAIAGYKYYTDFEKIYMANGNLDLAFAVAAPAAVPAETETPAPAESEEGNTSEE